MAWSYECPIDDCPIADYRSDWIRDHIENEHAVLQFNEILVEDALVSIEDNWFVIFLK